MCNISRIITCKLLETAAATSYNVPTEDSSRQIMVIVLRSFANLRRCMVGNAIIKNIYYIGHVIYYSLKVE